MIEKSIQISYGQRIPCKIYVEYFRSQMKNYKNTCIQQNQKIAYSFNTIQRFLKCIKDHLNYKSSEFWSVGDQNVLGNF